MPINEREINESPKQQIWKMAVRAVNELGGNERCISLKSIINKIYHLYPETHEKSENTIGAVINYHCINMRSRFPDPRKKKKKAVWITNPLFYRCGRGKYRALAEDEIASFKKALEQRHTIVYKDEYTIEALHKTIKQEEAHKG